MKVVTSSEYLYSVYESVLKSKNITDMHPYCYDYYKPEALANTYQLPMIPMPDKKDWSVPKEILEEFVLPPRYKRMPGRPKKGRKKYSSEKIRMSTNYCSRCGHEGHNIKTCNFIPKEK
ncbi:uncharacterized protein LOC129900007 [Solanum dulcamara]|uniref:uncharacterized protein LOC129900007 n=1 Tax=Solanum dulcamara TaxID=45834 RepID=UPI002485AD0D|nr:uncharacterized protein LOC129900007 [Solanum dulcamara]